MLLPFGVVVGSSLIDFQRTFAVRTLYSNKDVFDNITVIVPIVAFNICVRIGCRGRIGSNCGETEDIDKGTHLGFCKLTVTILVKHTHKHGHKIHCVHDISVRIQMKIMRQTLGVTALGICFRSRK